MKPDKELIKKVIIIRDAIDLTCSDNSISIKTLSSKFEIDRKTLGNIFRELFSEKVRERLNRVRVEKAKGLLEENKHKICKVARLTGFASRTHFCRVFKDIEGISPKQYQLRNVTFFHLHRLRYWKRCNLT